MGGFSQTLLKNHFTLYQGYVTYCNKLLDLIASMLKEDKVGTPEYAELKRRMGFEFNGTRLHEYYFGNPGGKGALDRAGKPGRKLAEEILHSDWLTMPVTAGIGWFAGLSLTGKLVDPEWIRC